MFNKQRELTKPKKKKIEMNQGIQLKKNSSEGFCYFRMLSYHLRKSSEDFGSLSEVFGRLLSLSEIFGISSEDVGSSSEAFG